MKKHILMTSLLLALSGSLSAATIATVNGVKIDSSEVDRHIRVMQKASQGKISDSPELRQYIANNLITEQLVLQEAKRLKLDKSSDYKNAEAEALKQVKEQGLDKKDPDFKQNWAGFQMELLRRAYFAHVIQQRPVSDAQVQQRYNQIKARYHNTDEVQMGEIITNNAANADAAIKELSSKKKFADVAKKYSQSASAQNNGGIVPDYVALADIKEANQLVYQAVANLNKGQFTKTPLKDGDVNLILYVNDKRKISVPDFASLKDDLTGEMEREILSQNIDELGKKAKIVPAK